MQKVLVPAPVDGFQIAALDGEIVLLHPTRNIIIYSNQTGALIWQLCDGVRTAAQIVQILSAVYPEAQAEIAADVPQTIQTLIQQGALRSE